MRYDPRESTGDRQKKAQQRLADKVAVLERWLQDGGAPEDAFCPKRIGAFLDWEDPGLRIDALQDGEGSGVGGVYHVSAVTADKENNLHLKARAKELMELLARPKKPSSLRAELDRVKAGLRQALRLVQSITNDNVCLREKAMTTERNCQIFINRIENLSEENGKLRKKLAKVTSLHVVPGGDGK